MSPEGKFGNCILLTGSQYSNHLLHHQWIFSGQNHHSLQLYKHWHIFQPFWIINDTTSLNPVNNKQNSKFTNVICYLYSILPFLTRLSSTFYCLSLIVSISSLHVHCYLTVKQYKEKIAGKHLFHI